METEEWKQIVIDGIEWNYEVSTHGRVKNTKDIILKQYETYNGYLKVMLWKDGKLRNFKVHRLVGIMFIPNPHGYTTINHKDHNRQNNCIENLEWMSLKNNSIDGAKQIQRRVKCIETGIIYDSISQASRETGLDRSSIRKVCRGKLKTCGKLHWEYT